jgi:hypothetical protein
MEPLRENRRTKRLPLHVPVHVYGRVENDKPFRDVTQTLLINAHGGLLPLSAKVERGQKLVLVHSITQEERECRVVTVSPAPEGKRAVGIEFIAGDHFWHVSFPATSRQAL